MARFVRPLRVLGLCCGWFSACTTPLRIEENPVATTAPPLLAAQNPSGRPTIHRAFRRITARWPIWTNAARRADADRQCANESTVESDAGINRTDASTSNPLLAFQPEVWIFDYPLGPISTGAGFGANAYSAWEDSARALRDRALLAAPRRRMCFGPSFVADSADGETRCETYALLRRALRERPLRECHSEATHATVLLRAFVSREGWIVPIEASARREHAAIAQCAGRAVMGYVGLEHDDEEGAETVIALRWSAAGCW